MAKRKLGPAGRRLKQKQSRSDAMVRRHANLGNTSVRRRQRQKQSSIGQDGESGF